MDMEKTFTIKNTSNEFVTCNNGYIINLYNGKKVLLYQDSDNNTDFKLGEIEYDGDKIVKLKDSKMDIKDIEILIEDNQYNDIQPISNLVIQIQEKKPVPPNNNYSREKETDTEVLYEAYIVTKNLRYIPKIIYDDYLWEKKQEKYERIEEIKIGKIDFVLVTQDDIDYIDKVSSNPHLKAEYKHFQHIDKFDDEFKETKKINSKENEKLISIYPTQIGNDLYLTYYKSTNNNTINEEFKNYGNLEVYGIQILNNTSLEEWKEEILDLIDKNELIKLNNTNLNIYVNPSDKQKNDNNIYVIEDIIFNKFDQKNNNSNTHSFKSNDYISWDKLNNKYEKITTKVYNDTKKFNF